MSAGLRYKKMAKKILLGGLLITLFVYTMTVFHVSGSQSGFGLSAIEKLFYIDVNAGVNRYGAGAPFASETIYYYDVEGCPCSGTEKAKIIWPMILSPGFFANWAIFSILPGTYFGLKERHAHTRH